MLSSSFASSGNDHSTTKRKCIDSSSDNFTSGLHDSGSIAKRRRTPATASSEAFISIATTAPISIPMHNNGLFSFQHTQDATLLHHPSPQQPPQMPSLYQLNTPPIETYYAYDYDNMENDEMMLDDNIHALPYRLPSPLATPLQSNPKPMGPFNRSPAITPVESAINSPEGDINEDPMEQIWNRRSRDETKRKNLDGEVIGYKMGFLADCIKCQMKVSGHSGHFIRKNH